MPATRWAIGVDLGATKIETAKVAADGQLTRRSRYPTPESKEAVTAKIVECVRELIEQEGEPPAGVGLGVAGQVAPDGDRIEFAPNLGWENVPLGSELSSRLGISVTVLNDVRAATWGEWLHGAGRDCGDLACVFVGTGIGGGVALGGRMLYGHSNTAGEIGHMTVELDGRPCRCGNRGCVEAYAGGWAIAERAQEAIRHDPAAGATLLRLAERGIGAVSAKTVAEAVRADDRLARRIADEAAEALTAGMVSVVNAFNPCRLIFGGGVIEGLPELVEQIDAQVHRRALQAATAPLHVLRAQLRGDAAVVGAAAYVMDSLEDS